MTLAHVGALPLEELLALLPTASVAWLALRSRKHRDPWRARR
jgi:hypothetical protein